MKHILIMLVLAVAMSVAMAAGSQYTWIGVKAGGDWQDRTNWDPNVVPTAGSTAIIRDATTIDISCVSNQVKNLTVKMDADCRLQIAAGVTVNLRELRVGSGRVANGVWNSSTIQPQVLVGDGKLKLDAGGIRIICRETK